MTTTKSDRFEAVSTEQLCRELSKALRDLNECLLLISAFQRELSKRQLRQSSLH